MTSGGTGLVLTSSNEYQKSPPGEREYNRSVPVDPTQSRAGSRTTSIGRGIQVGVSCELG